MIQQRLTVIKLFVRQLGHSVAYITERYVCSGKCPVIITSAQATHKKNARRWTPAYLRREVTPK